MAHSSVAHEAEHEPGGESGRAADAVPAQGRCDPPQSKGVVVSVDAAVLVVVEERDEVLLDLGVVNRDVPRAAQQRRAHKGCAEAERRRLLRRATCAAAGKPEHAARAAADNLGRQRASRASRAAVRRLELRRAALAAAARHHLGRVQFGGRHVDRRRTPSPAPPARRGPLRERALLLLRRRARLPPGSCVRPIARRRHVVGPRRMRGWLRRGHLDPPEASQLLDLPRRPRTLLLHRRRAPGGRRRGRPLHHREQRQHSTGVDGRRR
mmetsp:Transcript_5236/g.16802  ORF Transcript_5236/g.16802 Transcript_5236/m.16802 type:complete len:267 (-) Transcript_5236:26-826(-)